MTGSTAVRVADLTAGQVVLDVDRTAPDTFTGPREVASVSVRRRGGRPTGKLRVRFTDGSRHEWHRDRIAHVSTEDDA